ncbi:hypothetical protein MOQ72_29040 [Saccharopolyspora sp. K220]|uniref:hypothetical protein n=1 Tax=Saccharopolyspora soli TaxID=2926618 RepID=UPI001F5AE603|nr:hypothetical protein [Saccharopolyspora soli]MCI2421487.1 hypothetical protein [Saccharopolyspora soli]
MTFFPLPDEFHSMPEFLGASDAAVALYARAASWSACHLTDGHVPTAALPLFTANHEQASAELVERKVWRRARGGFQFADWPKQASRAYVEAKREAWRLRQQKTRSSQGGMSRRDTHVTHAGVTSGVPDESQRPYSTSSSKKESPNGDSYKGRNSAELAPQSRLDVEQLCSHMLDRLTANGVRASITKQWRDDARRLLDNDKRDLHQALRLIDWATAHRFWSANIHSIPKFRKQYDKLRMQAERENTPRSTTKADRIDALDAFLVPDAEPHLRALPGGVA